MITFPLLGLTQNNFEHVPTVHQKSLADFYHSFGIPLEYSLSNGSSSNTRLGASSISYNYRLNQRLSMDITVSSVNQKFQIKDSLETYFNLNRENSESLALGLDYTFRNTTLDSRVRFNNQGFLESINMQIDQPLKSLNFLAGIQMNQDVYAANFGNHEYVFEGDLYLNRSLLYLDLAYVSKYGDLNLRYGKSLKSGIAFPNSQALRSELLPHIENLSFNYEYQNEQDRKFHLFIKVAKDTVNSSIEQSKENIGSIYALDHEDISYGATYFSGRLGLSLSKRFIQGKISGSLKASRFGDLFTQLSGARYFHLIEGDAEISELQLIWNSLLSNKHNLVFTNSLYLGQGNIFSRHYVFQLFDPLNNLKAQSIKVQQFLGIDLGLLLQLHLKPEFQVNLLGNYLIPLAMDIETHPKMEVRMSEIRMGTRISLDMVFML